MNHVRLDTTNQSTELTITFHIAPRQNAASKRRDGFNREVPCPALVEQTPFRSVTWSGRKDHFIAKFVGEIQAVIERVLLSASDDHSGNDMKNTHGFARLICSWHFVESRFQTDVPS